MRIERSRIEAHAETRLGGETPSDPRARLKPFKRFLKLETDRLRMHHRYGLGGLEIAAARSYQVDQVVSHACRRALQEAHPDARLAAEGCAVVALGGYGRAELAPYSDVDLLFLHPGRTSEPVRAFVEQVLQILWDIGLTVGHSFRSVSECLSEARGDLHSRTALAEARLVSGDTRLFAALDRALDNAIRGDRRSGGAFLELLKRDVADRHRSHGAVCVQEPNVKEGLGALRDLHAVLWAAQAWRGPRGLAELGNAGLLTPGETRAARRAYDFLLRVRTEIHFASGRKNDVLTLDLQPGVAARLGYRDRGGLLGSEILMRDYFRRASELHELALRVLRPAAPSRPRTLLAALRRPVARDFEVQDGRLRARSARAFTSGERVLAAFGAAQAAGVPLCDELRGHLREAARLVGPGLRASREAAATFVDLLRWRGRVGPVLRAMHEAGFLGRFLPEFGRISFLLQHDFFHRYTIDEHTLRALEALDEVARGSDPAAVRFGPVLDAVEDAAPLYLGLLLHDVGKCHGGGHAERGARLAPRVCARLGLGAEASADVTFLVAAHLEMSQVSQQRDLSEATPIAAFAERVGTIERLNLLLLLTYADHRGVGPGIWNEWKATLLWDLYEKTRQVLAGHPGPVAAESAHARAAEELRSEFDELAVERHFSLVPERYLRATDAARMVRHYRLIESRAGAPAAFDWQDLAGGHQSELTVVTDDRPGLFARIAGTLTANGVDVLAVDLFTRRDGLVIDTFRLSELATQRPVRPERRVRVERDVLGALAGTHDVAAAVARWLRENPPRKRRVSGRAARGPAVRFDQESSATATIVEVKAQDRPGLAWTISETLASLGLAIVFAKIATAKALALDVFYVTRAGGSKLEPEDLPAVEAALLGALGGASRRIHPDKEEA